MVLYSQNKLLKRSLLDTWQILSGIMKIMDKKKKKKYELFMLHFIIQFGQLISGTNFHRLALFILNWVTTLSKGVDFYYYLPQTEIINYLFN